jgi:DNA-binding Lrp family transcriptional regulator
MIKLDLKDKKILFMLSNDASLNYSKIAKHLRMSRDVVVNRIKKLEQEGIIKAYKLGLNYKLLGYDEYDVYIKLVGVNAKIQQEIIHEFESNKYVSWIGSCFGNYDLRISIQAKTNEQALIVISHILSKYRDHVQDQEIVSLTKKYKLNAEVFVVDLFKELKEFKIPEKRLKRIDVPGKISLDKEDRELIKILNSNPTASLVNIAAKIGMTPEGVKYKITRLKEQGVITRIYAIIDGNKLDRMWCTFVFKININEDLEKEVESYLLSMKNATAAVRLMGKWDLGLTIYAPSIREINEVLNGFKNKFKDHIKDYDALIIMDIYKYPHIAEGVLEDKLVNKQKPL